jgi:hypothetical protein
VFVNWLKKLTIPDFLLLLVIIIVSIAILVFVNNRKDDLKAYIYSKNNLIGIFSLNIVQTIRINDKCTAETKKGFVRMSKSDCPDKRCVKQGWSNSSPIICLPNQIVIEIHSDIPKQLMHILY